MYQIDATICGVAPLLQHRYRIDAETLMEGAEKRTGTPDYSLEWLTTMYVSADGHLVQPATHIDGTLVRAAAQFKVKGSRGKTYKELIRAYCYTGPDEIPHLRDGQPVRAPGPELLRQPEPHLSVNIQRAIVNRSAVARARLQIASGWTLTFTISVVDDQIRPEVVQTILEEAGRAVGIGDYRPRYGRFAVTAFALRAGRAAA